LADVALVRAGGDFFGQLSNPFPYIALSFGICATVVTQFGFLRARALEVVPAVNSAAIITPLVLEVIIYEAWPDLTQFLLIAVIVTGVYILSVGAAARVSETKEKHEPAT